MALAAWVSPGVNFVFCDVSYKGGAGVAQKAAAALYHQDGGAAGKGLAGKLAVPQAPDQEGQGGGLATRV